MTTRLLARPVVFAALFVLGCYGPTETPKAEDTPVAEEKVNLPVAPVPKPKKTSAELLVGTWKLIKVDDKLEPAHVFAEFKKDGQFTFRATDPPQTRTGTYQLTGNTLHLTANANGDRPGKSWDVVIEVVTETELVTVAGPPDARQRSVSKRVERK